MSTRWQIRSSWQLGRGTIRAAASVGCVLFFLLSLGTPAGAAEAAGAAAFRKDVEPILAEFCSGCHSGSAGKAKVAFDQFPSDRELLESSELWWKALRQLRGGLMPPREEPQPSPEQKRQIADWIKTFAFRIDPANPDPGRVTVRRLNRNEYRNTIRDLIGVDFKTDAEFPPDDTGHGFDNIGRKLDRKSTRLNSSH